MPQNEVHMHVFLSRKVGASGKEVQAPIYNIACKSTPHPRFQQIFELAKKTVNQELSGFYFQPNNLFACILEENHIQCS
jgi:hypothetical protein